MSRFYSYCIPYDDGAAPNPYWGVCTLVICKPGIRRTADIGDWIVGTGSTRSPIGDISGYVVYAMQVTCKMTMAHYDVFTKSELPAKIPAWTHRDARRRLGDSLYNFSDSRIEQRKGVHPPQNQKTDLGGQSALLSEHFYYFGDKPVRLPDDLQAIVRQGQGYRVNLNEPYVERFVAWIDGLGYKPNTLVGKPQLDLFKDEALVHTCATGRRQEAEEDEKTNSSIC